MIKLCAFSDEAGAPLHEQISALLENEIYMTEIRSVDGKNISEIAVEEAREIKLCLDGNNIKVWSIGSPLGKYDINADFEPHLAKAKHVFELANILGAKNVRIFSFFNAYENPGEVNYRLNQMTELANKYKLTLCHENEKDVYGDTLKRVLEIKNNVKDLKLIFDPANFVQCKEDVKKTLEILRPSIHYYHIKDAELNGAVVPAGFGAGALEEVISGIDSDKVLTLEPHLKLFEGYAAIDNTELKNKFTFGSGKEAFKYAADALKALLYKCGYKNLGNGEYIK